MTKELQAILSQPENRIRYALSNMDHSDEYLRSNALTQALCWIAKAEDPEAHY